MNEDKANKKDIERNNTEVIADEASAWPIFQGTEIKDIYVRYLEAATMV